MLRRTNLSPPPHGSAVRSNKPGYGAPGVVGMVCLFPVCLAVLRPTVFRIAARQTCMPSIAWLGAMHPNSCQAAHSCAHSHRHRTSDLQINRTAGTNRAFRWLTPNPAPTNHACSSISRPKAPKDGIARRGGERRGFGGSHEQMPRGVVVAFATPAGESGG